MSKQTKKIDINEPSDFVDKKGLPKWGFIALAIAIVVVVFLLQLGMNVLRAKTAPAKNDEVIEEIHAPLIDSKSLKAPVQKQEESPYKAQAEELLLKLNQIKENPRVLLPTEVNHAFSGEKTEQELLKAKASMNAKSFNLNEKGNPETESIESNGKSFEVNGNSAFLSQVAAQNTKTTFATKIENLHLKVLEGKTIHGVIDQAINSDLPALVKAHVTEDVIGEEGDLILIPNGSRLIGKYRSGFFKNGDVRIFIVWTRIIEPNGISINIDSAGSDEIGQAGMTGLVDHHYLLKFGGAAAASILSAGSAVSGVGNNDQYNSKAAFRSALSQSLAQTANEELQKNSNVQNTIVAYQGQKLTIQVQKDLSFEHVLD